MNALSEQEKKALLAAIANEGLRCNAGEIITALLTSISYNRDERHMIALALEVKNRIDGKFGCWTEDGNTVFGTLVCLYGDYGISPRSGWIQTASVKEACCKALDDFIEEVKSNL